MVLKLHGSYSSGRTRLVLLVLKEKNIPYEFIPLELPKGEQKLPGHLKYHPFGLVPVIDDDGFILYEARAICRYIATKYASHGTPGLIPTDLKANALFEQAVSIEASYFDPYAPPIGFEYLFKKLKGLEVDKNLVDKNLKALSPKLDVYDQILSKQKYLAGDDLTLADLFHLPYGTRLVINGHADVFLDRPNVARWWKDISSRPAWQAVLDTVASNPKYSP